MIKGNVFTTEEQVVIVKEKKSLQITIEVDQDFLTMLNGIRAISTQDAIAAGMTYDEAEACYYFYDKVVDVFEEHSGIVEQNSSDNFVFVKE